VGSMGGTGHELTGQAQVVQGWGEQEVHP
jgi:hypothetical protein